jgi:hypothetical protein
METAQSTRQAARAAHLNLTGRYHLLASRKSYKVALRERTVVVRAHLYIGLRLQLFLVKNYQLMPAFLMRLVSCGSHQKAALLLAMMPKLPELWRLTMPTDSNRNCCLSSCA